MKVIYIQPYQFDLPIMELAETTQHTTVCLTYQVWRQLKAVYKSVNSIRIDFINHYVENTVALVFLITEFIITGVSEIQLFMKLDILLWLTPCLYCDDEDDGEMQPFVATLIW